MPEQTSADRERIAREALLEITPAETVAEVMDETVAEDAITLRFAARLAGYPGWYWSVSLAELDGEPPTVLETELLPGDEALLAPDWVPWSERLEEYQAAQAAEEGVAESGDEARSEIDLEDDDDEDDEDDEDEDDEDEDDEDEDDEDDDDEDELDALDDDFGDDLEDDGIDFEPDDEDVDDDGFAWSGAVTSVGEEEEDESESEPDEDRPEQPDESGLDQDR